MSKQKNGNGQAGPPLDIPVELADYTAKPHQVITDIPGVGPSAAEKIDKIMLEFWRDNPQEEEALAASK